MIEFTKEEIPATQAIQKVYTQARRDYDSSITKVIMLQKEKKPNPPKIQLAEQDRERMKAHYLQKGEEAWCSLLDTNEKSEFETLEKLLTYIEAFYQFFRGGYNFLRDVHDNVVIQHRQWIAEERGRYEARKKKRPAGEWVPDAISGGAAAKTRMFGLPYEEIIRRDQPSTAIPTWLEKAIDFLEVRALGIVGIFRISPPKANLDDTKKKIDAAQDVDWNALDEHVCTGTIKLFLRELPQPLLTFELYAKFMASADLEDEGAKIKAIKSVMNELPKPNVALLKRLLALMVHIERHKEVNKMSASNLAVVLCPSILYPEVPDPTTMVEDIQRANRIMAVMILHYEEIFGSAVPQAKGAGAGTPLRKSVQLDSVQAGSGSSSQLKTSSKDSSKDSGLKSSASAENVPPPTGNPPPPNVVASNPALSSSTPPGSTTLASSSGTTADTPSDKSATDKTEKASTSSTPGAATPKEEKTTTPAQSPQPAQPSQPQATSPPVAPVASLYVPSPVASVDIIPKIDFVTMQSILKDKSITSTHEYFMALQDVADAACQFASVALKPGLSGEQVTPLNAALKNVARAIKNILGSVKDFSGKLPPELRNRLLLAAKELQDRVLAAAGAFKEFAESGGQTPLKLLDSVRNFIVASYAIAARVKEFSLVDELVVAAEHIVTLVDQMPSSFAQGAIPIANNTNALQNASYKLAALMRAKILDSSQQAQVDAFASCIGNTEKMTREICDDIKTMLFDESLGPEDLIISPTLDTKLKSLSVTAKQVELYVDALSPAQNLSVSNASLFSAVAEQLMANINTHTANPEPAMQGIVSALRNIADRLVALKNACDSFASKRSVWIDELHALSEQFTVISTHVQSIVSQTQDQTVHTSLKAYIRSLQTLALFVRLVAPAEAFEINTCSDSLMRSLSYVKDFVFISFPVLFNIRDALILIEEEKQSPE